MDLPKEPEHFWDSNGFINGACKNPNYVRPILDAYRIQAVKLEVEVVDCSVHHNIKDLSYEDLDKVLAS